MTYNKYSSFLFFEDSFMMFTRTISKSWLFQMQFQHKFACSQYKLFNALIHFKLIKNAEFFIFFKKNFHATNSAVWQKHQSILFSFFDTPIFVYSIFFTINTIPLHCFYIAYFTEVSGFFISSLIFYHCYATLFIERNLHD